MHVDWFTVGAQIVNFLVLVYLLKRFLYGPVVDAMDRREQRVTDRLREARQSEEDARARADEFVRKQNELEEQRQALLAEARNEAERRRHELVEEVRAEVAELRRHWGQEIEREKESFVRELRAQAAGWISAAARRALAELADAELESRIVAVFQERIRKLSADERERLAQGLAGSGESLRVVTTFELGEEQRDALRETLAETIGDEIELRFAESADLVCGIELRTPESALAWSFDAIAGDLAEGLEETLGQASQRRAEDAAGDRGGEERADADGEAPV